MKTRASNLMIGSTTLAVIAAALAISWVVAVLFTPLTGVFILPDILGNAGGPRQALDIVGGHTFFLINGDTISDVNLRGVAAAHEAADALVTLWVVGQRLYYSVRRGSKASAKRSIRTGWLKTTLTISKRTQFHSAPARRA